MDQIKYNVVRNLIFFFKHLDRSLTFFLNFTEDDTHTEQYGLFLWLTKLLGVRTILQTSQ